MTKRQKAKAINLITDALATASEEQIKRMLCGAIGHPPVLTMCFGYQYCARCGEQLGDTLCGVGRGDRYAIIGHDCDNCRTVWKATTPEQRLLTTPWTPEIKETKE